MPIQLLAEEFLKQSQFLPVIDVRTPAEWEQGHIPGSVNIPIFSNDERAKVGTRYKNSGKEFAVELGLEVVGPKMLDFVRQAKKVAKDKKVLVHCWRGGMRSASMAWLFETAGLEASTLIEGYKGYRKYIREQFGKPANLIVLGGHTGSGKTDILKAIEKTGEQFLDIEGIAHHKGSAFGTIGQLPQLTNEHFENILAEIWLKFDRSNRIWIEDESRSLGINWVPEPLFKQMRVAKLLRVVVPKNLRIKRLVREYAFIDKEMLMDSVHKIERKLGGLKTKQSLDAIQQENYAVVADITLDYYDKGYAFGNSKRDPNSIIDIIIEKDEPEKTALLLLDKVKTA
ncbi:MAG: tRNA 2-selenouridine(34) synthase MnmH [Bacteroidales bacterium]|jgi:tRNA 2-selenouridine synthase|nr:tRNA 2-selenouridine(34) synthase MnmH [Bacteroidales bacterium]